MKPPFTSLRSVKGQAEFDPTPSQMTSVGFEALHQGKLGRRGPSGGTWVRLGVGFSAKGGSASGGNSPRPLAADS